MMLEGHSREGTNASPFRDSANNFSEKNMGKSLLLPETFYDIIMELVCSGVIVRSFCQDSFSQPVTSMAVVASDAGKCYT